MIWLRKSLRRSWSRRKPGRLVTERSSSRQWKRSYESAPTNEAKKQSISFTQRHVEIAADEKSLSEGVPTDRAVNVFFLKRDIKCRWFDLEVCQQQSRG